MSQLEEAGPCWHGDTHDDGLAHSCDFIGAAMESSVKEVVGGLLKGRQIQHTVLHLGDAEAGVA